MARRAGWILPALLLPAVLVLSAMPASAQGFGGTVSDILVRADSLLAQKRANDARAQAGSRSSTDTATMNQLNRDSAARTEGAQRTRDAGSSGVRSGGTSSYRPNFGGGGRSYRGGGGRRR